MLVTFILLISILLQFVAAIMALRLIPLTGKRFAWGLIALALMLMAMRRCVTLIRMLSGDTIIQPDLIAELIALVISLLMVVGISRIASIFIERKQAEEALLIKNLAFDTSIAAKSIADAEGVIIEANYSFLTLWGYTTREEVVGNPISHFFKDIDEASAIVTSLNRNGHWQGNFTAKKKNGSTFISHSMATVIRDKNGKITGYQSSVSDITEHRQAEEALRQNRDLLARSEQIAHIGSWTLDLIANRLTWSDEVYRIFGFKPQEFNATYEAFLNAVHPDDRTAVDNAYSGSVREAQDGYEIEHRIVRQDSGEVRHVHERCVHERDEAGSILRSVGIVQDITERKQIEEQLRAAENTYRNIFLNAQIGMFRTDIQTGLIVDANDAVSRFLGFRNREEMLAAPFSIAERYVNPGDREKMVTMLKANGEFTDFEAPFRRNDGSTMIMRFSGRLIPDKGWLEGVSADITKECQSQDEIYRLNAELEQRVDERTEELHESQLALLNVVDDLNENAKKLTIANESQEALNKELEAFSYSVSHDLRAPLRSIDGFSAALLEDYAGKLDKTGKDYLTRVRLAAQHMGGLIDDLLNLSRVSKADFHPKPVNLSKMLIETVNFCKKQAVARNIKVKIQDNVTVTADAALLQVALANLIDNAFKFTGKKENSLIEFGVKNEDGQNVFYIRDNGTGFDMTYVDKLFGPFQRLHTFDEFEGTGVGLATVQRIIHRHGGQIWAEGKVNKGATFYFTLP